MANEPQTSFTFRLSPELHLAARRKSVDTRRSLNQVLVERLEQWVNETDTPAPSRGERKSSVRTTQTKRPAKSQAATVKA